MQKTEHYTSIELGALNSVLDRKDGGHLHEGVFLDGTSLRLSRKHMEARYRDSCPQF